MVGINLQGNTSYTTATTSDDITSLPGATKALADVKSAISQLASDRANIGSNEESLSYYNDQLASLKNNLSAANSRITDVDVAQESTNYAKYNILVQSGTAMLAQANSLPQSVLKLLG
jgi:flagellin